MTNIQSKWSEKTKQLPLIAILRGIQSTEAPAIGQVLLDAGFRVVEVPLNSPKPFTTIEILAREFGESMVVGAGTVLDAEQVQQTIDAGGELIIAPSLSEEVSAAAMQQDCIYCPGVTTPTEVFQALGLGADALKLFPAEMITPQVVKAMHAVLPEGVQTFPVGGITPDNMTPYLSAGATGFGIGSALYSAGKSADDVSEVAKQFVSAFLSSSL